MNDTSDNPMPLLGAPLKVIVLGSQAFAEALEAQHIPIIVVPLQPTDNHFYPDE